MSKAQSLTAHTRKRSGSGALNSLRREGLIPAVVYGKSQPSLNVRLNAKQVETVLHHSVSEQILVNLTIEDTGDTRLALIQDVQHNPLTGAIIHLDFHAISENERIHANVPLELFGDAAGVKAGGLLEHLVHKIEVQCLPKDLPEIIRVDVTGIEVGKALHLREIPLPEGVRASADGELIVALVSEPRVAEPTPAEAAPAKDAKGAKGGKAKK